MTQRPADILFASQSDRLQAHRLQKETQAGRLQRLAKGVYAPAGTTEETVALVQRNWQRIAGTLVPGAVVSHLSALTKGLTPKGQARSR